MLFEPFFRFVAAGPVFDHLVDQAELFRLERRQKFVAFDCGRDGPRPEYNIDMIAPGYCPSTPILQYVASSEIVVMKAEEASRNPLALAAREVLARLAPSELAGEPPPA